MYLKKQNIIEYFWTFIGTIIAIYICLPISNDGEAYNNLFNDLPSDLSSFDVSIGSEYFFWAILQLVKIFGGTLPIALIPIIFTTLLLKLKAFKYFGINTFYIYLSYACIFYLVNEGTQLRISAALGFAILSCVAIKLNKWIVAVILCIISFGFHITSIVLPFIFFLCYKSVRVRKMSWIFLSAGILLYISKISLAETIISTIADLLGGRYLDYVADTRLEEQNSSGLAFIYAFALFGVLIFLYYWAKFNPTKKNDSFDVCLAVCIYGNAILFWLFSTVAVAARLSDVLTIMIIPLLGTAIGSSKYTIKFLYIITLGAFTLMRMNQLFYFTF